MSWTLCPDSTERWLWALTWQPEKPTLYKSLAESRKVRAVKQDVDRFVLRTALILVLLSMMIKLPQVQLANSIDRPLPPRNSLPFFKEPGQEEESYSGWQLQRYLLPVPAWKQPCYSCYWKACHLQVFPIRGPVDLDLLRGWANYLFRLSFSEIKRDRCG